MKTTLKKWHIALMSFLTLFIAVFASMFSLRADTVDEETGEILTDNWELGVVFYDSTVDSGMVNSDGSYNKDFCKTPLTSIDWDASNNEYNEYEKRIVTIQINYKNKNAVTTYNPGELIISIPNLKRTSYTSGVDYDVQMEETITVGANDYTHSKYDWNFVTASSPSCTQNSFTFTNANTIEEKSNFEGSIQIVYVLTSCPEGNYGNYRVEQYKDQCTHSYSTTQQASLTYNKTLENGTIEPVIIKSNKLDFKYLRTYIHPWSKNINTFKKTAYKITSLDLLPNANDYYWVNYNFDSIDYYESNNYPNIRATNLYIKDKIPEGCIVFNKETMNIMTPENGEYIISFPCKNGNAWREEIIVGYPKSIYNSDANNLNISNTAELYADYIDGTTNIYQDTASVSLNLTNFMFEYTDELYDIKKFGNSSGKLYYESLIGEDTKLGGTSSFTIQPMATYSGKLMDIKIGDDLLYITGTDGNYRRLKEDEYYFSEISFPSYLYNGHGSKIEANKYDCELWIKYNNSSDYILFSEFKNILSPNYKDLIWTFTEDQHVISYYFTIKNLEESIRYPNFKNQIRINNAINIAESGKIYNFTFIQAYIAGVLQNEPNISSYANFITQEEIATFDKETYGTYMQRNCTSVIYEKFIIKTPKYSTLIEKKMPTLIQNIEEEQFQGQAQIFFKTYVYDSYYSNHEIDNYLKDIPTEQRIIGWDAYDLLPQGMKLLSSEEDIENSINNSINKYLGYFKIYDMDGIKISSKEFADIIKDSINITITNNWKNTGRTHISINIHFPNNPFVIIMNSADYSTLINSYLVCATYQYSISYDSFLEYGNIWKNRVYLECYNRPYGENGFGASNGVPPSLKDNGQYDLFESDINNNENINELIAFTEASITITSIVSTHQDVTTYVKTDQNEFSTGIVDTSCNSEYEYKLRVRTGAADVTNLVIYTSIEEAQPNRTRWHGEFLGIDTSYAENKGYTVKVWYSPNKTVGTLAEDTSWLEYDEATIDKSKVKSLAFQYLIETDDTTGTNTINPAVLPVNSLTYVLIKMKSPADENETRLARMDCWTQWNALDDYDRPVDFITGINSNVVKVALPNSVKTDDMPSISLKFTKEIEGTDSQFKNMKLNKADPQTFMIRLTSLTANDDGSYNQVTALLKSNQELIISQIPIGTYLLEELGDNYFDFVEFTDNNDSEIIIEGVTFERTDQGYIITVSENLTENIEFNIKVTNEIESERFYEDKDNKENLFLKNKIEENS